MKVHRKGNRSDSGDLTVTYTPPNGSALEVSRINGLSVYSPLPARLTHVRLNLPEGVALKGGELHVVYRSRVAGWIDLHGYSVYQSGGTTFVVRLP